MKWKDTEIKLRDDADKLWLDAARKPLVYVPENDASLNVLEAKTANYHMGLWELQISNLRTVSYERCK